MEKTLRLSADQREDLVAYLDGELPDAQAQQIDQVLARSEVARHEVEALARTWEMLDVLPTPKAPPEFTERTMTTLKVAEVPFDITEQPWFKPLMRGLLAVVWIAAIGLSGWVGYQITNDWVPNPTRQLLMDLPTVEKLDIYQEVESIDFLDKLYKSQLFDQSADGHSASPATALTGLADSRSPDSKVLMERHQYVVNMSDVERKHLHTNLTTFQGLDSLRRDHYRKLNEDLAENRKTGGYLSSLMQTYSAWLLTLTPGQREELRRVDNSANKLDLVRRYKDDQFRRHIETVTIDQHELDGPKPGLPKPLSMRELSEVMQILVAELPEEDQKKFGKVHKPEQYLEIVRRSIELAPDGKRSWPSPELQESLIAVLPAQVRGFIKKFPGQQRDNVVRVVFFSIVDQAFDQARSKFPKPGDLDRVLETLDEKQRAELETRPPEERRRFLQNRYFEQRDDKTFRHLMELRAGMWRLLNDLGVAPPRSMAGDTMPPPRWPGGPGPGNRNNPGMRPDRPLGDRPGIPPGRELRPGDRRRDGKDGDRKLPDDQ
ncbi:MAG: hypothetical protein JSS49_17525 [Planctomycetes bacterium]|nr:hypothetical protein [Planctomycetota bacterium]